MNLEELIALVREEAHKDRHRQGESTSLQAAALELAAEVEKKIVEKKICVLSNLSIRDWFAGQAFVGFYSRAPQPLKTSDEDLAIDANLLYRIADAMIVERAGKFIMGGVQ